MGRKAVQSLVNEERKTFRSARNAGPRSETTGSSMKTGEHAFLLGKVRIPPPPSTGWPSVSSEREKPPSVALEACDRAPHLLAGHFQVSFLTRVRPDHTLSTRGAWGRLCPRAASQARRSLCHETPRSRPARFTPTLSKRGTVVLGSFETVNEGDPPSIFLDRREPLLGLFGLSIGEDHRCTHTDECIRETTISLSTSSFALPPSNLQSARQHIGLIGRTTGSEIGAPCAIDRILPDSPVCHKIG